MSGLDIPSICMRPFFYWSVNIYEQGTDYFILGVTRGVIDLPEISSLGQGKTWPQNKFRGTVGDKKIDYDYAS